jgi:hypothetical protein
MCHVNAMSSWGVGCGPVACLCGIRSCMAGDGVTGCLVTCSAEVDCMVGRDSLGDATAAVLREAALSSSCSSSTLASVKCKQYKLRHENNIL